MKYFVRIGDRDHVVVIEGETITFDGEEVRAHVEDVAGTPLQVLRLGDEVHRLQARRTGSRGAYDISVAGHRVSVEALDERSRAIRELSGAGGAHAGPANLIAPMPGLIVRVNVSEGDVVRSGQGLVVMEAMKMENELRAPANGTVRKVLASPGKTVEKGALLLELERDA